MNATANIPENIGKVLTGENKIGVSISIDTWSVARLAMVAVLATVVIFAIKKTLK